MDSNSITLRSATEKDLYTLNDLMFELHDHHHKAVPNDFKSANEVQEEKSIARYLDSPECLVLVATITSDNNQIIVGFVTAQFCELTSPISKPSLVGNVDELYVVQVASTWCRSCLANRSRNKVTAARSNPDYGRSLGL